MEMNGNFTLSDRRNGIALAAFLTIEVILAVIANGAVLCITLYQRKHWRQPSTIFFTSLILAHLVMMLLYLPFTITALAAGEWIIGSTEKEIIGTCFFSSFLSMYTILIILMTLAAISFDRFLFIVKPHLHKRFMKLWVAVTLVVAIWILSAVLNVIPLFSFGGFTYNDKFGPCNPSYLDTLGFALFMGIIFITMITIIVVTCVWTFCFTHKFLKDQSIIAGESVYSARKRRLFGIFGSMLLVYIICFIPGGIQLALIPIIDTPFGLYATSLACYHFITVANPVVQSYFRPEIKVVFVSLYHKMSPVSVTVNDTV